MENTETLDQMVYELITLELGTKGKEVIFTDDVRMLIHKIAESCRDMPIIEENQGMAEEYAAGLTAEQVYIDMLHKIADAPTALHMRMSALMLIVIMDMKLTESAAE